MDTALLGYHQCTGYGQMISVCSNFQTRICRCFRSVVAWAIAGTHVSTMCVIGEVRRVSVETTDEETDTSLN